MVWFKALLRQLADEKRCMKLTIRLDITTQKKVFGLKYYV